MIITRRRGLLTVSVRETMCGEGRSPGRDGAIRGSLQSTGAVIRARPYPSSAHSTADKVLTAPIALKPIAGEHARRKLERSISRTSHLQATFRHSATYIERAVCLWVSLHSVRLVSTDPGRIIAWSSITHSLLAFVITLVARASTVHLNGTPDAARNQTHSLHTFQKTAVQHYSTPAVIKGPRRIPTAALYPDITTHWRRGNSFRQPFQHLVCTS